MVLNDSLLLLGLLSGVVVLLIIYQVLRDAALSKRLRAFEGGVEALHRELFKLENRLKEQMTHNRQESEEHFRSESAEAIAKAAQVVRREVQALGEEAEYERIRLDRIEERVREYFSVPAASTLDTSRVISLHKSGHTPDEIAQQMRASLEEVRFALKLQNLEPNRS
jgi:hypothetical protein